jgi:Cu/Zn superoxide dismutase
MCFVWELNFNKMKKYLLSLAIAGMALLSACTKTDKEIAQATLTETADNTKTIGTAKFYELSDGKIKMDIEMNFAARADSNVAVHFHEHGDCGNMGENTHGLGIPPKKTMANGDQQHTIVVILATSCLIVRAMPHFRLLPIGGVLKVGILKIL